MQVSWSAKDMELIGYRLKEIIMERSLEGRDKNNQPFRDYSTRPFAMPAAAIQKYVRKQLERNDEIRYFKRNRTLFGVILYGYKRLKSLIYAKAGGYGNVNLWATGEMWGDFDVIKSGENYVKLGFTRPRSAAVMYYNIQRGRDPLGISEKDMKDAKLSEYLNKITIGL